MKRWILSMLALLCIFAALVGCKSSINAENTPNQASLDTVTIHALTEEKVQLNANIDQQSQTIKELIKTVDELKNEAGLLDELVKDQPWLKLFRQPGSIIKSVKVSLAGNTETSVTVTDPALLNAFSGELYIGRELFGLNPGGTYNSDILPCNYQVKMDDGETYGITVPARGVLTFDRLVNHHFGTDQYIHQLCKALVKKPAFIPDLPLFAKMADSGLLLTKSNGAYYYSANRIQGLIYAFLGTNKIEIPVPANKGKTIEQYTFYSFGEKTNMILYEQYIQIIDREKAIWFKVDKDFPLKLSSVLTAG
jgi:hypothetical protein